MTALLSLMNLLRFWTAVLGLASLSAMPYFTCLPSTPFLMLGEILVMISEPLFRWSIASS